MSLSHKTQGQCQRILRLCDELQSLPDDPSSVLETTIFSENNLLKVCKLKEKDPGFGGLVKVQNKRREFLRVHEQFIDEY